MSLFPPNGIRRTKQPQSAGSKAVKRKQAMMFGGLLLLVGIGLVAAVGLLNSRTPSSPLPARADNPVPMTGIAVPGGAVEAKDAWKGQESARIAGLERKLGELQEKFGEKPATPPAGLPGMPPLDLPNTSAMRTLPPPIPSTLPIEPPPLPPNMRTKPGAPVNSANPVNPGNPGNQPAAPYQDDGIEIGMMDDGPGAAEGREKPDAGNNQQAAPAKAIKTSANYLTSGTFVRAQLLSGLDAPTGGQAQSSPQPILMRLIDDGHLPNQFRAKMKECLIVATGFGDLSSERAIIRTESLACITKSGTALDQQIKGFVAGEDGKAGIRGRLVTKQGQVLGNALLAGIGSGLGQAFQQNSTVTATSALGTTTSVQPGKQFQSGVTAGIGKAFDRLAQYYISLAEKLFPVIEVDAGRVVDVILTKGTELPMGGDAAPKEIFTSRYGVR
jgi:conjugal transfer pilus assembly protein TraB